MVYYRNERHPYRYVTYRDAYENRIPLVADINDPNSKAIYGYEVDPSGRFTINHKEINPDKTYLALDLNGRVLNIAGMPGVLYEDGDTEMLSSEGYNWFPHLGGWVKMALQPEATWSLGKTETEIQEEKRRQALADMSNTFIAGSPGMNRQYMMNNPNTPYEIVPEGIAAGTVGALAGPTASQLGNINPYLVLSAAALSNSAEASAKVHSVDYWKNIINSRTASLNVARVKEIENVMRDKYGLIWNGTDFVSGEEDSSETSPLPYLLGADVIKGGASYYFDNDKKFKLPKNLGKYGKFLGKTAKYAPVFTGAYYLFDWLTGEPDEVKDLRNEYIALIKDYSQPEYSGEQNYNQGSGATIDSAETQVLIPLLTNRVSF